MRLTELDELVAAGYPRPRLVREGWTDLCGPWEFGFDDENKGLDDGWAEPGNGQFDRTITVPFPPESKASGIGEPGFHTVVWYRRQVVFPALGAGERAFLRFGAVDYEAMVFVDGRLVGRHKGGHTPFSVDVTAAARRGEAVVVVRAEDRPTDVHQPRGKQDWQEEPHRIWYKRTTGIWQPVWTEVVPSGHIARVDLSADLASATVWAELDIAGEWLGNSVCVRLLVEDEVLAEQSQPVLSDRTRLVLSVPALENAWEWERFQWSPDLPRLVSVEASLMPADGEGGDRVSSYFGIRSVGAADRQFLLNGRPEKLRMVLSQGYWPESHLAAPHPTATRDEVAMMKAMGFNAARLHQKVEEPSLLYWADRLGLMVWEEMPSGGAFSHRSVGEFLAVWPEVIERDRSHPCIVAWVLFNESWGVPALVTRADQRELLAGAYHLTRALDMTRPVISNDGWEHVNSDIWGVHDYTSVPAELVNRYGGDLVRYLKGADGWPAERRVLLDEVVDTGQPVVLSEFGGVSLVSGDDGLWHGYDDVRTPDELAERLSALFSAVHQCKGLAGFCYTQFADTEQESNGLVSAERQPKLSPGVVRRMVQGEDS
jgi:beta-galactosidase/beta-glucuronidase